MPKTKTKQKKAKLEEKRELQWSNFNLPNIPLFQTRLPNDIQIRLWDYVAKAKQRHNHRLAGNIDTSLVLVDEDHYFYRNVIGPVANLYAAYAENGVWVDFDEEKKKEAEENERAMELKAFWVNFQNQHEFNPVHSHDGFLSFVIWMKIPTSWEEQHNLDFCKGSNSPCASDFAFSYSDVLGLHRDYKIKMGEFQEGWMIVFPAGLRHQVYPFYNCDEQRISISGNIVLL